MGTERERPPLTDDWMQRMRTVSALALALVLLAAGPASLAAQGGQGGEPAGEDVLSGFDAPLPGAEQGEESGGEPGAGQPDLERGFGESFEAAPAAEEQPRFWELDGFLRLDGSYNFAHKAPPPGQTDFRGLSKLRVTLRLELSLELGAGWEAFISGQGFRDYAYTINGREMYTREVLEQHEDELEFREVFLRGTPAPSVDLTVGRQIVVWGKSDNIRVVDVLNPLDFREPGLTDLEDLRLPVTMTRADTFFGDWSLTGIAVHEVRFNKNPAPGSDFFPFAQAPPEVEPDDGGENTEWGAALSGIFSGWDLALYGARIFNEDPHVEDTDPGPGVVRARVHSRVTMWGAAVNVVAGNWLYKSELAHFSGLEFFNVPRRRFDRGDLLLGVEYSGITDTTLSFEAVDRHLFQFDDRLEQPPDRQLQDVNQYVLAYRGSYLRERLDVVALLSYFGLEADQGSIQRYQLTYELAAALDLTGGVVFYTPGDGKNFLLEGARDNDRLFFELKWSF